MHRADPRFAGMLCGLVVVLPIAIWVMAHMLRLAVRITNAFIAGSESPHIEFYDAAGQPRYMPSRSGQPIPVPDVARAMVIMFAVWFVSFPVRAMVLLIIAISLKETDALAQGKWLQVTDVSSRAMIANLVSLAVHATMISLLLPTSFGRACLVMVVEWLTLILVVFLFVFIGLLLSGTMPIHLPGHGIILI